ncbi:hypothetical protein N0V93_006795 [Gnomoniopsis smithogilvyi]|uniref:BTB domain-containing protein n=1 Tax=Gnomoniopsis smithogilvyi TaxID=1191159 RepID=A0A9W9CV19_9PEZI|nr:hypothetical protein N0V93_006795 [Gnomoniopsis smithogilvyi]
MSDRPPNLLLKGVGANCRGAVQDPQGDDAVKVICGQDKTTFYIRKSSVCHGSRFFKTACLEFRETDTPKVEVNPKMVDTETLRDILRYLDALEPFNPDSWHLPKTIDGVLNLYRKARYLQVDSLTDLIIERLRRTINQAVAYLSIDFHRWTEPEKFEEAWKTVLIDAQVVFSQANEDIEGDCDAIRGMYMEFLHKHHGHLMELGKPFSSFMRQTPDLAFVMLQDAYNHQDRSILAPLGFSTPCVHCGTDISGREPFFILVRAKDDGVEYMCRKVACRRMAKRRNM